MSNQPPYPGDPNGKDPRQFQPGQNPPPPPQGQPQFGQSQPGQPQFGQPQSGQPQFGQPQPGQPQFGQPQPGQPQFGQSQFGQPQFGQPQPGQPQFGQSQPGQSSYGQPQPGPYGYSEPPKRKKRLGLILGIGIPVVVVAALGITAALVVPGMIRDQQATDAAAAFMDEREAWSATFTAEKLAPYSDISVDAIFNNWTASETDEMTQTECDRLPDLESSVSKLTAKAPTLKKIEGADSNAQYAKAQTLYDKEKSAYEASQNFSDTVKTQLTVIAKVCEYSLKTSQLDAQYRARIAEEMTPLLVLKFDQTEEWPQPGTTITTTFTCKFEDGCPTFLDMAPRKEYGQAYSDIYGNWHSDYATMVSDTCPTTNMQPLCDADYTMSVNSSDNLRIVGEAYTTDDPKVNAVGPEGNFDPVPAVTAAYDANAVARDADQAVEDQVIADLGYDSFYDAYYSTATDAVTAISDAAAASVG